MSAVQVAVRTRPTATFAEDCVKIDNARRSIEVRLPESQAGSAHERSENQKGSWQFRFDHLLHNTSQQALFDDTVAPFVDAVLGGYTGTVMCYGQTGAGKTFTHVGSTSTYSQRGIAPRAISRLFKHIDSQPQNDAIVTASYLEIYNDSLVDLLAHLPSDTSRPEPLHIAEVQAPESPPILPTRLVPDYPAFGCLTCMWGWAVGFGVSASRLCRATMHTNRAATF